MSFIAAGNPIPVIAQLGDGTTGNFVRAVIVDNSGNAIAGSPLDLTEVANGLYMDSSLPMPANIPYVVVQATSYSDSGYTVPSGDYIAARVFSTSESDGGGVPINSPVAVASQLGDGNSSLFLQGTLYDQSGSVLAVLPMPVVPGVAGLYQNSSYLMPDIPFVVAQFIAYTDADFTTPADEYISSVVYTNLAANPNPLPVCPTASVSIIGFKAKFIRDFPYGNTPASVMDADIANAIQEATCFINPNLFCSEGPLANGTLLLAAHFLVMNLRASTQGIAGNFPWLQSSKGVGNVSEAYAIPQRILDNPELAMLTQTRYGAQFLFFILPYLTGQMFTAWTYTNP